MMAGSVSAMPQVEKKKDSFTFLHLTDMHVRRKRQGHLGYEACINHVNKNFASADFVLMGGDLGELPARKLGVFTRKLTRNL